MAVCGSPLRRAGEVRVFQKPGGKTLFAHRVLVSQYARQESDASVHEDHSGRLASGEDIVAYADFLIVLAFEDALIHELHGRRGYARAAGVRATVVEVELLAFARGSVDPVWHYRGPAGPPAETPEAAADEAYRAAAVGIE